MVTFFTLKMLLKIVNVKICKKKVVTQCVTLSNIVCYLPPLIINELCVFLS